jgi:CRP-like cAMP-binding protein
MKSVETISNTLKGTVALCKCLEAVGVVKHIPPQRYLFKIDDSKDGVFVVRKGKVALTVEGLPHLDRVFSVGSVLGLPSTFTGGPYRLTARTIVDSEVAHVGREDFLELMRRDSALCLEATEMLVRELSFIHQAIHEGSRISARGADTRFMVEKLPSRVVRN